MKPFIKRIMEQIMKYRPLIILIFVPVLFTVLFGAAMSPVYVDEIPFAILDLDESAASREIVDDFRACSVFKIEENANSSEEIKEGILSGDIQGGLILPEGFGRGLAEHKTAGALVLMDGSNFLIGNNLMQYANKIFTDKNSRLQVAYMESGGIVESLADQNINTLALADRTMYNPQAGYFYYLYPGLLGVFIQQTYLNVLAPVLLAEKDRLRAKPKDRISRRIGAKAMIPQILQCAGLSFISALSCLLIARLLFTVPLKGSLLLILTIQAIFLACLTGAAFVIAAIFDDVTHCTQFVMFLVIPAFLSCGYGWPEFMMAPGFAPAVKTIWPLYYYSNPLKDLLLRGSSFSAIEHYIFGGLIFAAFWVPAGMWIYRWKIRTLNRREAQT
ncbi:MAG TPA: ABC transporter permease [Anaerovoracaceae bacterium]|nr:ABC transporter permease [Anaerovoracaceae bacterium]